MDVASKVLVLVAYLLFFSVQICFRYTAPSVDLDEYASIIKAGGHTGPQVQTFVAPVTQHGKRHILNKRFQPGDAVPAPSLEFHLEQVTYPFLEGFVPTGDPIVSRFRSAVLLRGPPVPMC
jgi:hypothetical protein